MAARTALATARDLGAELAFLTRALKAPTLRQSVTRLAERARAEGWSHEEFLAACLGREVAARESHSGEGRIRAARFPARKRLEEFDYDHARGLNREQVAHLGTLDFVLAKENVVFLGPPGTGKTHLAIGLAIRACQAGHRVLFATAAQWVARLAEAPTAGRLQRPSAFVCKSRLSGEAVRVDKIVGDVQGRVPVIVDDMISTGGTIAAAFQALQEAGAATEAVIVVASHGLFVGPAVVRMRELPLLRIVVTDSVSSTITTEFPLQQESLKTLLADVIRRLHDQESLGDLLVHR